MVMGYDADVPPTQTIHIFNNYAFYMHDSWKNPEPEKEVHLFIERSECQI